MRRRIALFEAKSADNLSNIKPYSGVADFSKSKRSTSPKIHVQSFPNFPDSLFKMPKSDNGIVDPPKGGEGEGEREREDEYEYETPRWDIHGCAKCECAGSQVMCR